MIEIGSYSPLEPMQEHTTPSLKKLFANPFIFCGVLLFLQLTLVESKTKIYAQQQQQEIFRAGGNCKEQGKRYFENFTSTRAKCWRNFPEY